MVQPVRVVGAALKMPPPPARPLALFAPPWARLSLIAVLVIVALPAAT